MKYSHSKAMAVFYKIVKLAKNGVLMIIHIYAKVSNNIIYINTMKKIALILLVLLPAFAKADFKTLSTEQVRDKIKQGLVIIDVRRQDEYEQYGVIPNAHKLTFFDKNGKYNIERWLRDLSKIVPNKDTPFVLVCAHASRTKIIGRFLDKKTAYQNIFELDGGINRGWIDKGLATTKIAANQGKPWYKIW